MKSLLIATTNPAKLIEIRDALQTLSPAITINTLNDVDQLEEPVEDGKTFLDNAKLKAKYYADATHSPTIADDGGLEIDALGGAPGVISRRWPGHVATDKELIDYALHQMKDIPEGKRTAKLTTCVCFYNPKTQQYHAQQESIEGYITQEARTYDTNGYPYRALFKVSKYNKFYDELSKEEHDDINHRVRAVTALLPIIKSL